MGQVLFRKQLRHVNTASLEAAAQAGWSRRRRRAGGNSGSGKTTTPFPGSIKQYFSGNHAAIYVRGATRDYVANSADRIHAPD
ncbi:hypothetical protein [Planotetraspora phitsanulokensis]|nr:hypothetical protein [Planotetraspora phitsanulokensis]